MKTHYFILTFFLFLLVSFSCRRIRQVYEEPEIEPLQHGIRTSSAIGYSASLAYTFFKGEDLPANVIIDSQNDTNETRTVLMLVSINDSYPLPFNSSVGQIAIAGIWGHNGGVITVLFSDFNILEQKYEFKGIHTIPLIESEEGKIMTLFAEQDIVIGEGSDTLLHLNMSNPQINLELNRLDATQPTESFVAAQQNVWFVKVNNENTGSNIYDDEYSITGGGQIAEVISRTGGILYHAMIDTKFNYSECYLNPVSGVGFIQNLKTGKEVDLGHIFLSFHNNCDGKAYVEFASGKYLSSNRQNVFLCL